MDSGATDRIDEVLIEPGATVAEALDRLDRAGTGALVLCGPDRVLVGLLTDGDVRRAVLRGVSLDDPCRTIANTNPITARDPVSAGEALYAMTREDIDHLPILDERGVLRDFLRRTELVTEKDVEESARLRISSLIVAPDAPLEQAIAQLDRAGTGALALCAPGARLVGLLTDGDLRRAILHGVSLKEPCSTIAVEHPIVAPASISAGEALELMTEHDIDQLPLVDAEGDLADLLLRRDLVVGVRPDLSAVIMAGGLGKRLHPLTDTVPKPMLPVGDRPLLERTIQQLRRSGIRDVSLTTHHLPESIVRHFGDGEAFGVKISYANEDEPLGTAGGLSLIERPSGPFVVINGDILTDVPLQEMLSFHREYKADMTVGVRKYVVEVPFGVVECEDVRITQLREKPSITLFINAGIYLLEPGVCDYVPEGVRFDMTDLIRVLLGRGRPVVGFPIVEYWRDVGRHEDYRQAQRDVERPRD